MKAYSMEDLLIRTRIGGCVPIGVYEITRQGTRRAALAYREVYKCRAGEFSPESWEQIVRLCIEASGSGSLLSRIVEHCRKHCVWLKTEKDREEYALDILVGRTYRYWKDFSPVGLRERSAFVFEFGEGAI